jgi:hypothetical protein
MKLLYKKDNYQLQEVTIEEITALNLELPPDKQVTYSSTLTQQRLVDTLHKEGTFSPISLGVLTAPNLPQKLIILDGCKRYKALLNFPDRPFLVEVWSVSSPEELAIKHLEHFGLDNNFYRLDYSLLPYLKDIRIKKEDNYSKVKENVEFVLGYLFGKPLRENWAKKDLFAALNLNKVIDRLRNENIVSDFNVAVDYVSNITNNYNTALALISKFGTRLPFSISRDYISRLTEESYYYHKSEKAEFIYNQL